MLLSKTEYNELMKEDNLYNYNKFVKKNECVDQKLKAHRKEQKKVRKRNWNRVFIYTLLYEFIWAIIAGCMKMPGGLWIMAAFGISLVLFLITCDPDDGPDYEP